MYIAALYLKSMRQVLYHTAETSRKYNSATAPPKIAAYKRLLNLFFNIIYCTILATGCKDGRKVLLRALTRFFTKHPETGLKFKMQCYNIFCGTVVSPAVCTKANDDTQSYMCSFRLRVPECKVRCFVENDIHRRDKTNYYLDLAEAVSQRCTCLRRHYGAQVVKNDEVISGYVGAAAWRKTARISANALRRVRKEIFPR